MTETTTPKDPKNPSGAVHPMIFLVGWAVMGVGLHRYVPLPVPAIPVVEWIGVTLGLSGGLLVAACQFLFWKHGTTDRHDRRSTVLITAGPYRLSRHPVYLGLALLMVGLSLKTGSLWSLVLAVPTVLAIQFLTVGKEEAYLEREFGEAYRAYKRKVRQWV